MYVLLMSVIIFILCYIANFSFSLFYNTKILSQKISKTKLKNMGLKLLSFVIWTNHFYHFPFLTIYFLI